MNNGCLAVVLLFVVIPIGVGIAVGVFCGVLFGLLAYVLTCLASFMIAAYGIGRAIKNGWR